MNFRRLLAHPKVTLLLVVVSFVVLSWPAFSEVFESPVSRTLAFFGAWLVVIAIAAATSAVTARDADV